MTAAVRALPRTEIIEGLTHAQYAQIDAEHSGVLQRILVSPLAYRVAREQEAAGVDDETDPMRLGQAIHTATLEPALFAKRYACWSGVRRGKDWESFRDASASAGVTILLEKQLDAAVAMGKAVRAHPIAGPLIAQPHRSELTIVWTHPRTGVRIKCRLDWIAGSVLVDLKSTRDPSPARFSTQAAQMGYHVQLALYSDAVSAAGLGAVDTKIVAVQSAPPHDVVVYALDEGALGPGRERYETALDTLVACRKSGQWPGQAVDAEVPFRLPAWVVPADDDLQLTCNGEVMT